MQRVEIVGPPRRRRRCCRHMSAVLAVSVFVSEMVTNIGEVVKSIDKKRRAKTRRKS
jgi:hypothetical protein